MRSDAGASGASEARRFAMREAVGVGCRYMFGVLAMWCCAKPLARGKKPVNVHSCPSRSPLWLRSDRVVVPLILVVTWILLALALAPVMGRAIARGRAYAELPCQELSRRRR